VAVTVGISIALATDMSKADELQQRTAAFADLSIEFVTGLPETQVVRRISLQFLDTSTFQSRELPCCPACKISCRFRVEDRYGL
jgi:hypothetical protein